MNVKFAKLVVALLAAVAAFGAAQAVPVVYFGENQTPAGTVTGAPLTAHDSFLSGLVGVGSDGVETQVLGATSPLALTFPGSIGNITATLTGTGDVANVTTDGGGRFNTTPGGDQWWRVSGAFAIDFSSAISAFGFYGTDIGDFNGQITIALLDTGGGVTNLVVPNTINVPNASLLFWGFTDVTTAYSKVTFGNTSAGVDFFGFDDLVIGDREQISVVPEPGTLALLGLCLAGLAASRRRKQ